MVCQHFFIPQLALDFSLQEEPDEPVPLQLEPPHQEAAAAPLQGEEAPQDHPSQQAEETADGQSAHPEAPGRENAV